MIFNNPPKLVNQEYVGQYVQNELYGWFKNIQAGLTRLGLVENFEGFRVDNLTIAAGTMAKITNPLLFIPSARIIVRQTGNGVITDGTWSSQILELFNNGLVPVTISVIFYR